MINRLLSWLSTPLYALSFAILMVGYQPILWISKLLGYRALKFAIDFLNLLVIVNLRLIGTKFDFQLRHDIPRARPLIVVSNHQSMYDVAFLVWQFRHHHPKFIAKVELGRWIPSVSFNLRHMGSVLIDRSDPKQALPAIEQFGRYIEDNNYCASIFPEGTRARDGEMKKFKTAGLLALLRTAPSALIVPVVIDGSWKLMKDKFLPVPFGTHITFKVLEPIEPSRMAAEAVCVVVEDRIRSALKLMRHTGLEEHSAKDIKIAAYF